MLSDQDLQDIITLNVTRSVQLCVDIASQVIAETEARTPETMAGAFTTLVSLGVVQPDLEERLTKVVGFRNVAAHNYQAVDWQIVHHVRLERLDDFREFAKAVVQFLDSDLQTS